MQPDIGGHQVKRLQNFTPEQMKVFQGLPGLVGPDSYTSKLAMGDPETMRQMQQRGLRDFSSLLGNISSKFSGSGLGGRKSSGFQLATGQAAKEFAENQQESQNNLRMQAIRDLMGLSNSFLSQRPYENVLVKPKPKNNFLQSLLGGVVPIAGAALGGKFGGTEGAKLGYDIGSGFSSSWRQ